MAGALSQGPETVLLPPPPSQQQQQPRSNHHPSSTTIAAAAPVASSSPYVSSSSVRLPPFSTTKTSANDSGDTTEPRKLSSIASAGLRTSPSLLVVDKKVRSTSPCAMATGGPSAEQPMLDAAERRRSTSSSRSNLQTAQAALGAIMGVSDDGHVRRPEKSSGDVQTRQSGSPSTRRRSPSRERSGGNMEGVQRSTSPVTMTDAFGNGEKNNEDTTTTTVTATTVIHGSTVASPGPIEDEPAPPAQRSLEERSRSGDDSCDDPDGGGSKALSYPAPLPAAVNLNDPRRGMSMPHSGWNKGSSPRSPGGSKKHQCTFCGTEFTRHHNLKSHLLTHSQEKPYVCQTCHSRFRRLHDLKRHTKLHTGERPHICPKCGRRFARGDALARHNKGSGGCAGRRSSMGSFGGGDDEEFGDGAGATGPDDAMEGLVYAEPEHIDNDQSRRRFPLPTIQREDAPSDSPHDHHRHQQQQSSGRHVSFQSHAPNTYPPLGINNRPPQSGGGLHPPSSSAQATGSSSSASPISPSANASSSLPYSGTSGSSTLTSGQRGSSPSIFAQSSMTESPKPLSPSAMSSRQLGHGPEAVTNSHAHHNQHQRQTSSYSHSTAASHSPSSKPQPPQPSQPHLQQPLGRGSQGSPGTGLGFPPSLNLPAPSTGAPQLPPPPGLNPPDARFSLHTPQSQSRSPLLSPAPSAGRPDAPQQQQQPPPIHSRSSTSDIPTVHETLSQNNNANTNNHTIFSQQQQRHSPQRQLSNPNSSGIAQGAAGNDSLWGYVRTLEGRLGGLESEITRLREQLSASQHSGGDGHAASATSGP